MIRRGGIAFVAACLAMAAWRVGRASAAGVRYGDVYVDQKIIADCETSHGYLEYHFVVTNRSKRQPHEVTIRLPGELERGWSGLAGLSRSATVGPDSTVSLKLYQPGMVLTGDGAAVFIDGERQRRDFPVAAEGHGLDASGYYYYHHRDEGGPVVLIGPGDVLRRAASKDQSRTRTGDSELPVTEWSSNWLAYSRYDGVVLTASQLQAMPPAVRQAVLRYVECGGSMLVVGSWQPPASWPRMSPLRSAMPVYTPAFGSCMVVTNGLSAAVWQAFGRSVEMTASPLMKVRGIEEANDELPVVENIHVPIRGMLGLMLVFILLIGPVNLLVLSRANKRMWLLWTVPAFSLLTCGLVFGYAVFSEGFEGRSRTVSLTVLDENTRRATTIGWTAFYCPLTPSQGLHFSRQTELTLQFHPGWRSQGGRSRREIDWTHEQHLTRGWITSRVPAHFAVRKSQSRRERLAVRRGDDGKIIVVNGLGRLITKLVLADRDGRVHAATNIPAGDEAVLTPQAPPARPRGNRSFRQLFVSSWPKGIQDIESDPESYLRPGTYVAVLAEPVFLERALSEAEPRQTRAVVYGILKGDDDGS